LKKLTRQGFQVFANNKTNNSRHEGMEMVRVSYPGHNDPDVNFFLIAKEVNMGGGASAGI